MNVLRAMTPAELVIAEQRLLHPKPGGRIEAAVRHGIDITLLIEQLRLTPDERARKLELVATQLEQVRGLARRPR